MAVTVNYAWEIPTVGASLNAWGGILNATIAAIDTDLDALETAFNAYVAGGTGTIAIASGGTGATTAPAALTALGGQPVDAALTAMSALNFVADRIAYSNGIDTFALAVLTAAGRALLDDADTDAQRTTLGLGIGTNVQAYNAKLAALAALVVAADQYVYATGASTFAAASITAASRALLANTATDANKQTVGVQPYSAPLAQISGITGTAGSILYHNGTVWVRLPRGPAGSVLQSTAGSIAWVGVSGEPGP